MMSHESELWPTPRAGNPGSRKPGTGGKILAEEAKKLWRTPQADMAGAKVETLYTKDGQPAKVGERAYRLQPDGRLVLQSQTINQQIEMDEPRQMEPSPQLPLLPADSLASLYLSPGSDEARKMTAGSGLKCFGSSKRSDPLGSLLRMLLASSEWASTIVWLTWRTRAMKSRRFLYQLVPRAPRTDGTESSLWATPNANEDRAEAYTDQTTLKHYQEGRQIHLAQEVKMWPTPAERDYRTGMQGRIADGHTYNLPEKVADARGINGQLNPMWVEWLMGFAPGWTDLEH